MKCNHLAALLLLTGVITACSGPSLRLRQNALSRAEANSIGQQLSASIETRYPLLKHNRVNRYVDSLGQFIVSRNTKMPPLPYEFRVLKTNEVLSLSTPSGVVYVSLGLLRLCEIESQFVAALSHELAHQRLGHSIRIWQERSQSLRSDSPTYLPERQTWQDHLFGKQGLFYYGEGFEREADEVALAIMYNADYDVRAMISYLQILKNHEADGSTKMAGLLSLHPPTLQRLTWTKSEVLKLPPVKDAKLNSNSFTDLHHLLKRAESQKVRSPSEPVDASSTEL